MGGGGLLGWVGGETIASDSALNSFREANHWVHYAAAVAGAVLVIAIGKALKARASRDSAPA